MRLPNGVELTREYRIAVSPSAEMGTVPADFSLANRDSLNAFSPELKLDRSEQAVFGKPSEIASIQEAHFWGGPAELSGSFRLGGNENALYIAARVRDVKFRLPRVWPGVLGSSVELFFDFRTPAEGLGKPEYTSNVFQFLILPPKESGTAPQFWCPQLPELTAQAVQLRGDRLDDGYWLTLEIPWTRVRPDGMRPVRFGFDAAVNGSFGDRDERKTQLMMFGTMQNFRDASKFGMILKKEEK
ncbi:hypothetical protein SDC9_155921 [bioreactor metagenome]|uniref:Carbohydrate-binding domain-containing protein n=1 Tax=bioreactor metagenome TaxID=1076179 RepID=A0A645F4S9_9ZZZZ